MHSEIMLRGSLVSLCLVLVAFSAYWQASGVARIVESSLRMHPVRGDAAAEHAPDLGLGASIVTIDHATSARPIFERNPFDSQARRLIADVDSAVSTLDPSRLETEPPCQGVKAFIVFASLAPGWSMAAVADGDEAKTRLVRVGERVGQRKVETIDWNRLLLSSGRSQCQVTMFGSRSRSPEPSDAGSKVDAVRPRTDPVSSEMARRIQKVSPNMFRLERQIIGEILEKQAELMQSLRIVPTREDGRVVGIRLYGLRPDHVLGLLGLEQGDQVDAINGLELTTPEKALEALVRLRTMDHLVLHLVRRGKEMNIDYDIQ